MILQQHYQGYGKGINLDIIHKINEFSIGGRQS
ncbi:MAG: hypothetical protein KatS3mg002_0843 [Candidatus Woesearchaeota archaeon]|nr:MAG: hypothetical protein KatS3mg002_0843 [Candidatus Woesearchaeota archaeon]